jgi:hypothetical protein
MVGMWNQGTSCKTVSWGEAIIKVLQRGSKTPFLEKFRSLFHSSLHTYGSIVISCGDSSIFPFMRIAM